MAFMPMWVRIGDLALQITIYKGRRGWYDSGPAVQCIRSVATLLLTIISHREPIFTARHHEPFLPITN